MDDGRDRGLPLGFVATKRKKHAAERRDGQANASNVAIVSVATPMSDRFKPTLIIIAFVYLATVWTDGIGSNLPAKVTPRVWLYFAQVAALFKNAGMMAIEYRAEGWSCSDKRWVEIDVRPWFRIDADTKENRFHRALQFYRKERKVMQALEDYVIRSNNASSSRPTIGGVRFLSLRIPYPKIGDHVDRVQRKPLSAYPDDVRHPWYFTPTSRRRERCGDRGAPGKEDEDRAAPSKADDPTDKGKDPEP